MFDWITSVVWDETVNWLYGKFVEFLSSFFAQMNNMGAELFELPWIQAIIRFFLYFGWGLYVVGLVIAVFDAAIEAQSGKADFKGLAINALKGFFAVNLFTTIPVSLYIYCINLQDIFTSGLSGLLGSTANVKTAAQEFLGSQSHIGNNGMFAVFTVVMVGYSVIKIFFQNIKRGGILIIQICVGSLYMFSIPRGYHDGFIQWCKRIIGLCFTAFMQTTLLLAGLITIKSHPLLGFGVMLSANEVERIAESFGLDTSIKAHMGGAAHTVSSVVNMVKSIKT